MGKNASRNNLGVKFTDNRIKNENSIKILGKFDNLSGPQMNKQGVQIQDQIEIGKLQFLNLIQSKLSSLIIQKIDLLMSLNNKKCRNIPAFLQKTYDMLQDPKNDCAIVWSPNGVGFIILNEQILTKHVLPNYFKHSNYSSFIRQLNMYDFHKIRKGNLENYFHHDKFVKGDLYSVSQIKRKPEKKKALKNITNKYHATQEKYFSESQITGDKKGHEKANRTEVTLNSVHTIKPKSEESIILLRDSLQVAKMDPIYYEECESIQENRFSQIDLNRGDYFQNEEGQDDDSSKMSINNEIQSKGLIEQQQQKEILVPSHNNIFHFINPYQFANFGLFL